ncbi:MAG: hypothetical protein EBZ48_16500 [Proteobacteria bacterium]|nr:hypothetical protein [Pseudomonadota bacterium]
MKHLILLTLLVVITSAHAADRQQEFERKAEELASHGEIGRAHLYLGMANQERDAKSRILEAQTPPAPASPSYSPSYSGSSSGGSSSSSSGGSNALAISAIIGAGLWLLSKLG